MVEKIKVRIALEISHDGTWHAYGYPNAANWDECMDSFDCLEAPATRLWIEAEVPVPAAEPATVKGEAVPA